MSTDKSQGQSKNKKRIASEIRDGLSSVRELSVAVVSALITLVELRPRPNPSPPPPQKNKLQDRNFKQIHVRKDPAQKEIDRIDQLKNPTMTRQDGPTTTQDDQKISTREMIRNHTYPALALISTIALVVGVARLGPIAQWARNQNECIETTLISNSADKEVLSNRIMMCNGGHD